MKPFYFTKEDGKLKGNWSELPDGIYKAERPKTKRSHDANRYYWGWFLKHLVKFEEELGNVYTVDQMHEAFKSMLLKERVYNEVGNKRRWITRIGSTSKLTKKQFKDYLDKINKMYLDTHGYQVPEPVNEDELLYWESLMI